MRRAIFALTLIAALGGCDSGNIVTGGKDEKATQVRMGDIDSPEGTISDEMINTDESTDEAPLDKSAPPSLTSVKKKEAPKAAKAETSAPKSAPETPEPAAPADAAE